MYPSPMQGFQASGWLRATRPGRCPSRSRARSALHVSAGPIKNNSAQSPGRHTSGGCRKDNSKSGLAKVFVRNHHPSLTGSA
eukprot:1961514-Amphidinium_carterae.1